MFLLRLFFLASIFVVYFSPVDVFSASVLAPPSIAAQLEPVLPGESAEAFSVSKEKIEEPLIARARKSHTHPQYQDPLVSVITLVHFSEGQEILLAQKQGETEWSLLEQESILGEDCEETALRGLKPWVSLDQVQGSKRIGFVSDPDRIQKVYVYSAVMQIDVNKIEQPISLPNGYVDARFFKRADLERLQIHSAHREIVRAFSLGLSIGDVGQNQNGPKISAEKMEATRTRHRQTIQRNQTQPNLSINGIVEMVNDKGEFQGVLLSHRGKGSGAEQWDIPGGHPAFGESAPQALCRELSEELGLQIRVLRDFGITTKRFEQNRLSYWSLFYVVEGKGTPTVDQKEVKAVALIRSLAELKKFAVDHPIAWDSYTFLTRYFLEREGKQVPEGLVDPLPADSPRIRQFVEAVFGSPSFSKKRKKFICEALAVLIPELEENKKGYLWKFQPEDFRFAMLSPLHRFLAAKLQENLSGVLLRFLRLGGQNFLDSNAAGGPAFYEQKFSDELELLYQNRLAETQNPMLVDRQFIEKYGVYRRKAKKDRSEWQYEMWYWVLKPNGQPLIVTLAEATKFVYNERNANAFLLFNPEHPLFKLNGKLSSSRRSGSVEGVPVPPETFLVPEVQFLLDENTVDIDSVLAEMAKIFLGQIPILKGEAEAEWEKRIRFELFKILFVSRLIEILQEGHFSKAVSVPMADPGNIEAAI